MKPSIGELFHIVLKLFKRFFSIFQAFIGRRDTKLRFVAPPRVRVDLSNPRIHFQRLLVLIPDLMETSQNVKNPFPPIKIRIPLYVPPHSPTRNTLVPSIEQRPKEKDKNKKPTSHEVLSGDKFNDVPNANRLKTVRHNRGTSFLIHLAGHHNGSHTLNHPDGFLF